MQQFEIWLANLNPQKGTKVEKIRPVVIIQSNLLGDFHASVMICPLSTNLIEAEYLRVNVRAKELLENNSQVLVDQIYAIDKKRMIKKLSILSDQEKEKLEKNLKIVLFSEF